MTRNFNVVEMPAWLAAIRARTAWRLVLVAVVVAVFFPVLQNGFSGDDEVFLVEGVFYDSPGNIADLFTHRYFPHQTAIEAKTEGRYFSGSVAYRPVLSATYFLDAALYGKNPAGFHLTNLVLHLFNVILLFEILSSPWFFGRREGFSFIGASLFAVHPVQAEAVAAIGYRGDLAATLFCFGAFWMYLRMRSSGRIQPGRVILTVIFFLLGVFAKESAIVFPVFVMAFEFWIRRCGQEAFLRDYPRVYAWIDAALVFYLVVYFCAFPNRTLGTTGLIGGDVPTHIASVFWIFGRYMVDIINPLFVRPIPALFAPSIVPMAVPKLLFSVLALYLLMRWMNMARHREPVLAFFLLWFLVALLPVANIIPLPNPMAHRFLYLPMAGLAGAVTWFLLHKVAGRLRPALWVAGTALILAGCALTAQAQVYLWKNSLVQALSWTRNFPDFPGGYAVAGMESYKQGKPESARRYLERAVGLGSKDPRVREVLGRLKARENAKHR